MISILLSLIAVVAFVFIWRWTRHTPVKHVSCAECLYVVEFAKTKVCPECGADLLQAGVLRQTGEPHQRPRRRLAANVALTGILALFIAVLLGQTAEVIADHTDSPPLFNSDGTQTITAAVSRSGAIHRIEADVHYTIRRNNVNYSTLLLTVETSGANTKNPLEISLPERPFVLAWRKSDDKWTGTIEPDRASDNDSQRILRESDVPLSRVMEWLADQQIDTDHPAIETEIESFLDYLVENMQPGSPQFHSHEIFATIRRDSTIDFLSESRMAKNITKWTSFPLLWLLFAWMSLRSYRTTLEMRRRDAAQWLNSDNASE